MKFLHIDDHPLITVGLQHALQSLSDAFDGVDGVRTADAARAALRGAERYDYVLLEVRLAESDGFELLRELRQRNPQTPIVVLSASTRAADVIRSIDLGAMGYIPKTSSIDEMLAALRVVMGGGFHVPEKLLASSGDGPEEAAGDSAAATLAAAPAADRNFARSRAMLVERVGLTPRQSEVLGLLLQGKPNKVIARELGLSVETVKDHVAAVLRALNVHSRTQAVLAVSQFAQGELEPPGWTRLLQR